MSEEKNNIKICSYEKGKTKCDIELNIEDYKKGLCKLHQVYDIYYNKDGNFENDENDNKKIEEIKEEIEKVDEIINGKEIKDDNPFYIYEKNKISRFINNNDIVFIKEDENYEFLHKEMVELEKNNNTEDYQDYLEDKDYYYENYKVDMDEINDIINEAALVNDVGYDILAISGVLHAATLIFKKFDLDYKYITYKDENNKFYIYHKNDYEKVDIVNELKILETITPNSDTYVSKSENNKYLNPILQYKLDKFKNKIKNNKLKEDINIKSVFKNENNKISKLFTDYENNRINEYKVLEEIGNLFVNNKLTKEETKEINSMNQTSRPARLIKQSKRVYLLQKYVNIKNIALGGISNWLRDTSDENFEILLSFFNKKEENIYASDSDIPDLEYFSDDEFTEPRSVTRLVFT